MADNDTTTATGDDPAERTVPYARFKEVNDRLAEERKERQALAAKVDELGDRDKPDIERLSKELEKARKLAEAAEERATALEAQRASDLKANLIAAAAAKHNFHDPQLAAQLVNLDDIEDAAGAERAVKALAKDRQYLVKSEPPEAARLKRVGIDGATIDGEREAGLVTPEEQARSWGNELFKRITGEDAPGPAERV